jgi:hypothetical protein
MVLFAVILVIYWFGYARTLTLKVQRWRMKPNFGVSGQAQGREGGESQERRYFAPQGRAK